MKCITTNCNYNIGLIGGFCHSCREKNKKEALERSTKRLTKEKKGIKHKTDGNEIWKRIRDSRDVQESVSLNERLYGKFLADCLSLNILNIPQVSFIKSKCEEYESAADMRACVTAQDIHFQGKTLLTCKMMLSVVDADGTNEIAESFFGTNIFLAMLVSELVEENFFLRPSGEVIAIDTNAYRVISSEFFLNFYDFYKSKKLKGMCSRQGRENIFKASMGGSFSSSVFQELFCVPHSFNQIAYFDDRDFQNLGEVLDDITEFGEKLGDVKQKAQEDVYCVEVKTQIWCSVLSLFRKEDQELAFFQATLQSQVFHGTKEYISALQRARDSVC